MISVPAWLPVIYFVGLLSWLGSTALSWRQLRRLRAQLEIKRIMMPRADATGAGMLAAGEPLQFKTPEGATLELVPDRDIVLAWRLFL